MRRQFAALPFMVGDAGDLGDVDRRLRRRRRADPTSARLKAMFTLRTAASVQPGRPGTGEPLATGLGPAAFRGSYGAVDSRA